MTDAGDSYSGLLLLGILTWFILRVWFRNVRKEPSTFYWPSLGLLIIAAGWLLQELAGFLQVRPLSGVSTASLVGVYLIWLAIEFQAGFLRLNWSYHEWVHDGKLREWGKKILKQRRRIDWIDQRISSLRDDDLGVTRRQDGSFSEKSNRGKSLNKEWDSLFAELKSLAGSSVEDNPPKDLKKYLDRRQFLIVARISIPLVVPSGLIPDEGAEIFLAVLTGFIISIPVIFIHSLARWPFVRRKAIRLASKPRSPEPTYDDVEVEEHEASESPQPASQATDTNVEPTFAERLEERKAKIRAIRDAKSRERTSVTETDDVESSVPELSDTSSQMDVGGDPIVALRSKLSQVSFPTQAIQRFDGLLSAIALDQVRIKKGLQPITRRQHFILRGDKGYGQEVFLELICEASEVAGWVSDAVCYQFKLGNLARTTPNASSNAAWKMIEDCAGGVICISVSESGAFEKVEDNIVQPITEAMGDEEYDVLFCFSGASTNIDNFLSRHEALADAACTVLEFPKWGATETADSFVGMCRAANLTVPDSAVDQLVRSLKKIQETNFSDFLTEYSAKRLF